MTLRTRLPPHRGHHCRAIRQVLSGPVACFHLRHLQGAGVPPQPQVQTFVPGGSSGCVPDAPLGSQSPTKSLPTLPQSLLSAHSPTTRGLGPFCHSAKRREPSANSGQVSLGFCPPPPQPQRGVWLRFPKTAAPGKPQKKNARSEKCGEPSWLEHRPDTPRLWVRSPVRAHTRIRQ